MTDRLFIFKNKFGNHVIFPLLHNDALDSLMSVAVMQLSLILVCFKEKATQFTYLATNKKLKTCATQRETQVKDSKVAKIKTLDST